WRAVRAVPCGKVLHRYMRFAHDAVLNSNSFQILNQILLLITAEVQFQVRVVMINHVCQRSEAAVAIEAALLVGPQSCQGRGAILMGGRTVSLERVNADFVGRVQVFPRLRKERWDMAGRALRGAVEDRLAPLEGGPVI